MQQTEKHPGGLREMKKARTRQEIQRQALRLFLEQGYAATTVEQIAQAAEVSPSTFFRYFGTKEDVLLYDNFDPLLFEAIRDVPTDVPPVPALRRAIRAASEAMPREQRELERARGELVWNEPELKARMLVQMQESLDLVSGVIAERTGRGPKDFKVRTLSGAIIGVILACVLDSFDTPGADYDYLELADRALAHLEQGLPL